MINRIFEIFVITISLIFMIFEIPIFFLNTFGIIIAGIWLVILGEWMLLFIGVFLLCTDIHFLFILMLPNMFLVTITEKLFEKESVLKYLFGFISSFYTNLLIIGTCAFAFFVCTKFYEGSSKLGVIPYLLWSLPMAIGPWAFFGSKEPENEFSAIILTSATILYFLFLISTFLGTIFSLLIVILFLFIHLFLLPIFAVTTRVNPLD